jgi:hypothetical protein
MNWVFSGTVYFQNQLGVLCVGGKYDSQYLFQTLLKFADHVKFHNNQRKSIATSAQYVILEKYSSHPSLVIHFFGTPPMRCFLRDWK